MRKLTGSFFEAKHFCPHKFWSRFPLKLHFLQWSSTIAKNVITAAIGAKLQTFAGCGKYYFKKRSFFYH